MKRLPLLFAAFLTLLVLMPSEAWSRGRGGGGGGARSMPRGGAGGGMRTPSMSRPQARPSTRPQYSRPNVSGGAGYRPNVSRPNVNRPSVSRPSTNRPNVGGNRPNFNQPGAGGLRPGGSGPGGSGRPSAGDLGDFLNLPGGVNRPTTLPGQATRPTPGNRPTTLPGQAARPTPGNRPNLGDRPNLGTKPSIGNRPNIGNKANIGSNNRINVNRQRNVNSIRNRWSGTRHRPFGPNWWGRYPSTLPGWRWHGGWGRYPRNWCWRHCGWGAFGTWFAWNWAQPVSYDYGSNVVYRDNNVYVDDQQYATSAEYYQQAETIAESIPEGVDAEQIEWMPLGVFAIAEEDGIDNGMLVQLAVSKEGIIAGTFYNDSTDEGRPLEGQVDRETQRAAWKFADGKNSEIVMETAIYNLTQEESTALVHFGADKTQTWLMVRLPEDSNEQAQ